MTIQSNKALPGKRARKTLRVATILLEHSVGARHLNTFVLGFRQAADHLLTAACTTGSGGTCTVTRSSIGSTVPGLILEVHNLTLTGAEYDPVPNEVTRLDHQFMFAYQERLGRHKHPEISRADS